jgi:protoporphyrinogen IX oxidase
VPVITTSSLFELIRALHIAFMVCWFAGIFYLPRLFVNHALATDEAVRSQLRIMEKKLYRFMTPFAWLTAGLGFYLLYAGWSAYRNQGWVYAKLFLVMLLVAYHLACGHFVRAFAADANVREHVFFRWFNEFPVVILFSVILLVELKPF